MIALALIATHPHHTVKVPQAMTKTFSCPQNEVSVFHINQLKVYNNYMASVIYPSKTFFLPVQSSVFQVKSMMLRIIKVNMNRKKYTIESKKKIICSMNILTFVGKYNLKICLYLNDKYPCQKTYEFFFFHVFFTLLPLPSPQQLCLSSLSSPSSFSNVKCHHHRNQMKSY